MPETFTGKQSVSAPQTGDVAIKQTLYTPGLGKTKEGVVAVEVPAPPKSQAYVLLGPVEELNPKKLYALVESGTIVKLAATSFVE